MKAVGIRELKSRLSEYLRMVRRGEEILVTDRGEVVAEIRQPGTHMQNPYPALVELGRRGEARLGAENEPSLYARLGPALPDGEAQELLDDERGNH